MLLFRTSKRVKRGAALLDQRYGPEWVDRIDPRRLNISCSGYCVLGQLYGSYYDGAEVLELDSLEKNAAYGFTLPTSAPPSVWQHLTKEWVQLVNKRQLARSA